MACKTLVSFEYELAEPFGSTRTPQSAQCREDSRICVRLFDPD